MITLYIDGKTQFFHIQNTHIQERLSDVGEAIFEIPVRTPDGKVRENITAENLREMQKIRLTKTANQQEKIFFEGFIHTVEIGWDTVKVTAKTMIALLEYRILKNGINFLGASGSNVIAACAEATGANALFQFEANIPETMKKRYEIGRSMLDILRDIARAGYDFVLEGNMIRIGEFVGVNRIDSVRYEREHENPRGTNITDITLTRSTENIANYILTKIASSPPHSVEDAGSIAKYGRIERYITVNADDAVTPSQYLNTRKNGLSEYSFRPIEEDYTRVNVGDMVSVSIAGIHPLLQFSGPVKIIEKSYRDGDIGEVTLSVATGHGKSKTLFSALEDFDARISALERKE